MGREAPEERPAHQKFNFSLHKDQPDSVDLRKITIGPLRGSLSQEKLVQEIFEGTKYKVTYEPNMEDYLLCHAAFVLPAVFACYKTDGNLKRLKKDNAYLNRLIEANIEGYRAIRSAVEEMNALNRDMKAFFDAAGAEYPVWQELESECRKYMK